MKNSNLAQQVFEYDEQVLGEDCVVKAKEQLQRLRSWVRRSINYGDSLETTISKLKDFIFFQDGYDCLSGNANHIADIKYRTVSNTLLNKRGYCVELSFIYLMVAEQLSLPLYGIACPLKHMLIGYDIEGITYSIELTRNGKIYGEKYLENLKKKYSKFNRHNFYKHLKSGELLAIYLHMLSGIFLTHKDCKRAIQFLQYGVRLAPKFPRTHYLLGCAFQMKGQSDEAMKELEEEIRIDPDYLQARLRLTYSCINKKRYGQAKAHLNQIMHCTSGL